MNNKPIPLIERWLEDDMDSVFVDKPIETDSLPSEFGGPGSGNHGHVGRPGKVGGSAPDDVKIVDAKGIKKVGKAEKVGRFTGEFFILGNDVYYCELGHPYAAIALAEQKVISHRPNSDKVIEVVNQLDAVRVKFHYDDIILETREVNEQYLTQLQELMLDGIIEIDDSDRVQWGSANNKNILKTTTIDGFLGAQNIRELSLFKPVHLGGPGSGHHGHKGRPGQRGGSAPEGADGSYPKANPNGRDTFEQFRNPDGTWTKERQALHEEIIAKFFKDKTPVEHPTSYLMGGGPASGKTTMLRSGSVRVPENHVLAAGDDIKELLPEYIEGVKRGDVNASQIVHEESSYLSKIIASRAAEQNYNVLMDGTGDSGIDSLKKKVDSMRPNRQPVIGIYATVDIDTAKYRAIERAKKTGRWMPESVLVENHKAVSTIFPQIVKSNVMEQVNLFDTMQQPPKLIAVGASGKLTIIDKKSYQAFLDKADYANK